MSILEKKGEQEHLLKLLFKKYVQNAEANFAFSELTTKHMLFNLENIKENVLKFYLNQQFDRYEVLQNLNLIFGNLYVLSQRYGTPFIFRHYLKIIGILGEGVQGIVSSAELLKNTNNPVLVIKNSKDTNEILSLKREFIVSQQLNKLSKKTPVFSWSYGASDCSRVFSMVTSRKMGEIKKTPLSFCTNNSSFTAINQLVPGEEYARLSKEMTKEVFLKDFLILLFGLRIAGKEYGYTHYDLHISNVLQRKIEKTWAIPVEWNNKTYYIYTKTIPVIIDYGLSRIEIDNKVLFPTSPKWIVNNGITEKYFPLHDVYKFLYYSLLFYKRLFDELSFLTKFFDKNLDYEDLEDIRKSTNFVVPKKFNEYSLDDYINSILPKVKYLLNLEPSNFHVYGQYSNKINILNEIGINTTRFTSLRDSYQFYLLEKFGEGNEKAVEEIKNLLPIELKNFQAELQTFLTTFENKYSKTFESAIDNEEILNTLAIIGDNFLTFKFEIKTFNFCIKTVKFKSSEIKKLTNILIEISDKTKYVEDIYINLANIKKFNEDIEVIYPPIL